MATYIVSKNTRTEIQNQFQDYFDPKDQEKWTDVITVMVASMIQLEKSLKPHIQKLTIES